MRTEPVTFKPAANRSGFTLLELLIALGLGVLLIGSVGATLMIYLRTESSGRQRMQRAQIVRSIYLRMSEDLRDVIYIEQITTQSSTSDLTAAEETEMTDLGSELGLSSEDDQEFLSPSEAIGKTTSGLYGDGNSLVIYVNRPKRLPPRVAAQPSSDEDDSSYIDSMTGSGLRCISWYQNDLSSVGLMVDSLFLENIDTSSGVIGTEAESDPDSSTGLCRLDHDAIELLNSEDVFDLVSSNAQVLAPEVITVQFRYFDGIDWVEEWDSTAQERLPNAVEVILTFEEVELTANQLVLGVDPDGFSANTVRFVIALPMAPPPMTEVEL